MDMLDYQLIQAIAESDSLEAAAKRVGITGSAVNQRLTKLDNHLDQVLVHRQRKPQLTKAGLVFLESAKKILSEYAILKANLENLRHDYDSFRVMVNPSIAISDLMEVLEKMIMINPKFKPNLLEGTTKEIIQSVLSSDIDAGIIVGSFDVPGLQFIPYKQDRFCIVAQPSHALSQLKSVRLKDALKHPLIGIGSKPIKDYLDALAKSLGVILNYKMTVSSFETQMNIVAQTDIGIAIVAESLARRFEKNHRLKIINLDYQFEERDFAICIRKEGAASAASLAFTAQLVNRFKRI